MQTLDVTHHYNMTDTDLVMADEGEIPYVLRVRDMPLPEKPREKLVEAGPDSLSAAELVAIIFGVGTKKEEVLAMSKRIVKDYGEVTLLNETSAKRLADSLDIPIGKACQLVASFELGRRYYQDKNGKPVFVKTARQAYEHFKDMSQLQKEQLRAIYLNSRYRVIQEEVISIGSLTANIVHPREVFQPAIAHGAVAVIIAHNHPSDDLKPTPADSKVTKQLYEAGQLLGIELLDHIIVTSENYQSCMSIE